MSGYFDERQAGLAVLQAAGIPSKRAYGGRKGDPPPVQAFRALVAWLRRAQRQGRLAMCDAETLGSTILGSLHNRAFTARACGQPASPAAGDGNVERFLDLLWNGVAGDRS
jgi:hypothetical protein